MRRLAVLRQSNPRRMLTAQVWNEVLHLCANVGAAVFAAKADPPVASPMPLPHLVPWEANSIQRKLANLGVTELLSISDPDSQALHDARLRWDYFQTKDALNTLRSVSILIHKGLTREVCNKFGIPISNGYWIESPKSLSDHMLRLSGVVVVKPVNRWSTEGISYCSTADLPHHLQPWLGPVVVEEFWSGEEVSVEVVRVQRTTSVIGWAVKGPTSPTSAPLLRLRYAEGKETPPALRDAARSIVEAVDYEGIMEAEFIVAPSGRWVLTEVNPRPSGVTPLLARSQGRSSVAVAISMFYGAQLIGSHSCHVCDFAVDHDAVSKIRPLLRSELEMHPALDGYPPRCYVTERSFDTLMQRVVQIEQATGLSIANQLKDRKKAYEDIVHM